MYAVFKEHTQLSPNLRTIKEVKQWFKESRGASGNDLELTKTVDIRGRVSRGYTAKIFGSYSFDVIKL